MHHAAHMVSLRVAHGVRDAESAGEVVRLSACGPCCVHRKLHRGAEYCNLRSVSSGDHGISTDLEHNSELRPLYDLQTHGVSVDFAPADRQGNIRYEDMETLFRPETKAVVCTHASNLTGNLLDIAKIGAMAHAHSALLVVDASQTAGAVPIDMQAMKLTCLLHRP